MLIEFNVENYRSIKDEVTLSLVASSDPSLKNNLITTPVLNKDKLLRSAVLYGANASGKTNVILALNALNLLVQKSHKYQKGSTIDYSPFRFDKKYLSKPTKFKITFIHNNIKYMYGVDFTSKKIIGEYLFYYPEGRKALIFERKNTNNYTFNIDKKDQNFFADKTPENVLYISRATQLNYEKTSEAYNWFKNNLKTIGPTDGPHLTETTIELLKNKKSKKLVINALLRADLGIEDISATEKKLTKEDLPGDFPAILASLLDKGDLMTREIQISHQGITFNFDEESEGTRRLFSLIGLWIIALKNGSVLVVDELDTKLHHVLNEFLIKLFHDPSQNKKNAQLIFTTHNINLLDQKMFRRDQIWFTEKKPDNSTDLYSLLEFKPRKDKDIKKGYLAGRYGALPFIKENNIIYE